jgi:PAS domain S-box-containing protein
VLEQETISRIKILLKAHPKGLTITDISSKLKMNRNSAAKYLEILQISGQVESKSYGTAKVYFLTHRLPISALVSIASDLVVTLDENYHILFVNESFCNLFAMKKEDATGNHIVDIFKSGIGRDILPGIFSDVLANLETVREIRLPDTTGDLFFKIKSMKTVFDDGSRGITIVMEDVTREKRDQMELEAKESRYRGIVEDQTDFIVRFLPDGTITFVNASYAHALKKTPEEIRGAHFPDSIYAGDRTAFDRCLRSLNRKNPASAFECRFAITKRATRWISWTLRAIFDDTGTPIEYQGVGQDITEKKEASEKLQKYLTQMLFFSKKLQQFIELPPDGDIFQEIGAGLSEILPDAAVAVSSYDPETVSVTIRAALPEKDHDLFSRCIGRDLIGMKIRIGDTAPPEEFLTGKIYVPEKDLFNIVFQHIPADICTDIEETLNLGKFYSIGLMWGGTLLGNITFALRKGQDLKDESLIEAYVRAAAISLRRSIAEHALKESETLYRTVIENMQDVFYRADTEGNLLMASPSAAAMLGYPSLEDLKNRNIARDFYMEPAMRQEFLAAVASRGSVSNYEIVLKRKDGSPLYIETNSHIYYDKDGTVLGIEGTFHDISGRKTADKKVQLYISEIELLSQKLLDFMLMEPSENIYDKIASDLQDTIPGSMIFVNSFDPYTGIVKVQSAVLNALQRDTITRLLGKEPAGSEFPINADGKAVLRTGRLQLANVPLFDILFKSIPEPVCDQLESELAIGTKYAIGFVRGDEIMGSAAIFLGRGRTIADLTLIETYARVAAIALQRFIAEEARHRSDEIFYNIAQNSSLPIALIEPDGTYRYINESFTRLFGYDLSDFHTGREWFRLVFPDQDYRRQVVAAWKSDLAQSQAGSPFSRTWQVRCRDSTVKEVIFRQVALSDGKFCTVCEDITERNKAEQTRRLLSSIIESTSDAVIGKDPRGIVISWNRAAERLYGYSEDEIIGHPIAQIIPAEKSEEAGEIFRRIERKESVSNLETQRKRKDGRLIDVSLTISPIFDEDGTVIGASTIARDITPVRAENRLRESEEQYRSLVENISVGIYRSTGDPRGHFLWGNSSLVHILGYPSFEDLSEIGIEELFVEQDGRKRLLDDLKRDGFVKNREIALHRADGDTVSVLVTALARFGTHGELSCINGIVEDITSQRQAEHRMQLVTRQMQDILAFISDPVVIVDTENVVVGWNSAMEQLTGMQKKDVIGRNGYAPFIPFYSTARPSLLTFFDSPDEDLEQHYPGAYRNGTSIIAPLCDLAHREDESVAYTIHASPLCDPEGARIGAVQIIRSAVHNDSKRLSYPPGDGN